MDVCASAKEKIRSGRVEELTHEEWKAWSLFGKDRADCQRYIATLVLGERQEVKVDIYHNEINAAVGTASILFRIGFPGIPVSSILEISLSNEAGDEKIHLSRSGGMIREGSR